MPPLAVPNHTCPGFDVNPEPLIVIVAPGAPLVGETLVIAGLLTVSATEFDQTPLCCTWAVPVTELAARLATICVLVHDVAVA